MFVCRDFQPPLVKDQTCYEPSLGYFCRPLVHRVEWWSFPAWWWKTLKRYIYFDANEIIEQYIWYQPYYHELNLPEVEPVLVYLLGLKIHVSRRSLYPECEVSLQTQIGHLAGSYFCKIYQTNHSDEKSRQTIKKEQIYSC